MAPVPLVTLKFVIGGEPITLSRRLSLQLMIYLSFPFAHVDLAYFDQNKHSRLEEEVLSKVNRLTWRFEHDFHRWVSEAIKN
ncbi:hypothetical protein O9993_01325 [Vibrio lentus]|nr:hypothetical protein [Vibrio lentus]